MKSFDFDILDHIIHHKGHFNPCSYLAKRLDAKSSALATFLFLMSVHLSPNNMLLFDLESKLCITRKLSHYYG